VDVAGFRPAEQPRISHAQP